MNSRYTYCLIWGITLVTLGIGLYYYPSLPEPMVGHWNAAGQADGFISKVWGVWFVPLIMAVLAILLPLVPRLDPLRANIESFRPQYNMLLVGLTVFFAVIQAMVLAINLGSTFNIVSVIMPAIGILFFLIGAILPKTKRNWFIGIRTPWTISSDTVWSKTHRIGGRVFQILGIIAVVSAFSPAYTLIIFLPSVVVGVVGIIAYSYFYYRELSV